MNGSSVVSFCGISKEDITPPTDLLNHLYCVMKDTRFEKIDLGLFVRSIAIKCGRDTMLFVSCELDNFPYPQEILSWIEDTFSIPQENVFLLGNHSHSVPVTGERPAEPQHSKYLQPDRIRDATLEYEKIVDDGVRKSITRAVTGMRPVRLYYGFTESSINTHRESRYPSIIPVDRELFIMKIENMDGRPMAFLLNYSMHNSCVKRNDLVTADAEGCICALMESYYPGSICVWTLSAHGDLMPRRDYQNIKVSLPDTFFPGLDEKDPYLLRKNILSLRQTEDAVQAMDKLKMTDIPCLISGAVKKVSIPVMYKNSLPFRLRIHLVRFGSLVFIGIGGKLYNYYKILIRESIPPSLTAVVFSMDASLLSTVTYIRDPHAVAEAHENEDYSDPVFCVRSGEIEKQLLEAVRELMKEIENGGEKQS